MATSLIDRTLGLLAKTLSRRKAWHRWPFPIALAMILGHRENLRENNLTDMQSVPPAVPAANDKNFRSADGSHNDLKQPWMGMAGARFGRNMPIENVYGEGPDTLLTPNPRLVSNALMARKSFIPVPHLNVLAAGWIQFMVHDWLSHGPNNKDHTPITVPLPDGDDWPDPIMSLLPTDPDRSQPEADIGRPTAYINVETSWWDASQIYGSTLERQLLMRTNPQTGEIEPTGKLYVQPDGSLPVEVKSKSDGTQQRQELAGVNGNWWIGLSVLHRIFAQEHNAIVDRLRIDYPDAKGEWLFQKARLVNAALLAKIHTVEWTPALMNSPEGRMAMRGNYWGVMGETFGRAFGRVGEGEILSGIPGSSTSHHTAPYAMTEEFAASYRLHSLIPDSFTFKKHNNGKALLTCSLEQVSGQAVLAIHDKISFDDVMHSLATSNPGALVLHNYPDGLRRLDKDGRFMDLAAVDILRDRERGVPRYCLFRQLIGAHVPKSFADLTDDADWQRQLEEIYGTVDKVDLLVGTLAESRSALHGTPVGFGFSDTAFRIFILMASRRLKSDRFYTDDFTPEVYTPAGFAWVADNSLRTVMGRHCPALQPYFANARSMFFPWKASQP